MTSENLAESDWLRLEVWGLIGEFFQGCVAKPTIDDTCLPASGWNAAYYYPCRPQRRD
jgi:hypothetical protein